MNYSILLIEMRMQLRSDVSLRSEVVTVDSVVVTVPQWSRSIIELFLGLFETDDAAANSAKKRSVSDTSPPSGVRYNR